MKVLFFAPYAISHSHHEADIELIVKHLRQGDEVHAITCIGNIPTCDLNHERKKVTCLHCRSVSKNSFSLIGLSPNRQYPLSTIADGPSPVFPTFSDIEVLRRFKWQGVEVGLAVATSLVLKIHDMRPDMSQLETLTKTLLTTYLITYRNVQRHLERLQPDLFYVFNAKTTLLHAAYAACRDAGVKVIVVDRDKSGEYLLHENVKACDLIYSKHELAFFQEKMALDPNAEDIAADWFIRNRQGNVVIRTNYLMLQKKAQLPIGFDPNKRNIAFFGSSEWEFVASPDMENPFFKNHCEAIKFLACAISDPQYHFYFREHPHLGAYPNSSQSLELNSLSFPQFTFIRSTSDVDSYALLEACEKTISLGSTISIEAVFWKKPSLVCGRATYEDLKGACDIPRSREAILDWIRQEVKPPDPKAALPYGYWNQRRGIQMKYVETADTHGFSRYEGQTLLASFPVRVFLRIVHWLTLRCNQFRETFRGKDAILNITSR